MMAGKIEKFDSYNVRAANDLPAQIQFFQVSGKMGRFRTSAGCTELGGTAQTVKGFSGKLSQISPTFYFHPEAIA
jgi:hypothetical protein